MPPFPAALPSPPPPPLLPCHCTFRCNALRDPDYAWARAELQKVLHLKEEFFNRTWAMTDVHDAMTSMKVHGKKLPAGVSGGVKGVCVGG